MTLTTRPPELADPAAGQAADQAADPGAAPAADPVAAVAAARQQPRAQRRPPAVTPRGDAQVGKAVAASLVLMAVVVLGFAGYLYGLSRLSEQRSQNVLYKTFAGSLAQAVAPVGPVAPGTPVALMDLPSIGVRKMVVVEGTDARRLMSGPGHRRDTPLPGQAGVSVVYGRRATFGGPFANLSRLHVGDPIHVVTGQGVATYVVSSFGTGAHPALATSANRLVLTTAGSSLVPSSTVSVSADLRTKVQPSAGSLPTISDDERSLHGAASESVLPLMLWGQALVLVAIASTIAVRRWSKWPAYLCFAPAALAVLWNVYENAAALLPNVL